MRPPVTLQQKVDALLSAPTYPHACESIEATETHFAWIFLTDEFAYKLKKPVVVERMDFRSVAARERNCREELRLNRRLAPEIYLEVVPLRSVDAALQIGSQEETTGRIVDWLVKMRRLPAERMLDRAIAAQAVQPGELRAAIAPLARFFRSEPAAIPLAAEYVTRMQEHVADAQIQLSAADLDLNRIMVRTAHALQAEFLRDHASLLAARADAGRVIEGHGDLRPEHIFLGQGALAPCVIDCLEFDRDLRVFDSLEEIAFLHLECTRLDAHWVGREVLRCYGDLAHDVFAPELFAFYRRQRALTRAKISAWHLRDPEVREQADWRELAHSYLRDALHPTQLGD